jgi:mono/diheme cytochrome c family protein
MPRTIAPAFWLTCCCASAVFAQSAPPAAPQTAAPPAAAPAQATSFEQQIRPILKANCFHCHGAEGEPKGSLDVRLKRLLVKGGDQGPSIVPGKPEESLLYERIMSGEMPPGEKKLSAEQIELIRRWIAEGAVTLRDEPEAIDAGTPITPEERAYWAFQPIGHPAVPEAAPADRSRGAIDAFLLRELKAHELSFTADAEKLTLLKRASIDLTGLPPTPDDIALFLADEADGAYERLLDRLLASPRYGERWGRHWLDVAGYADSDGSNESDTPRQFAYKYRDYVIRSFNADKPLDQFLTEQLAGDELVSGPANALPPHELDKLIATGFLRMGADGTAQANTEEVRNQVVADTIKIVSTSLLGLSVGCAQCHDHRYDPIPQVDYFRLRAIIEPAYDCKNWRQPAQRLVSLISDAERAQSAELEKAANVISVEREAKQAEFMKAALEKELQKFPEDQRPALKSAYETPEANRTPEQKKLLTDHPSVNITPGVLYQYNAEAAEMLKKFDARINEILAKRPPGDYVQALTEVPGQIPVTFVFHRGDYRQPKDAVKPGALTVCSLPGQRVDFPEKNDKLPTTGRRLAFAKWLTGPDNPLTARVLANRIWLNHFGHGLVNTPGEFGILGERPSHPELLDWLAGDLVAGGWKLKRFHKQIMLSTAYRQSSQRDTARMERDGDDRLHSRAPVQRLDAETLRDRILSVTGVLNGRMFGPPIPVKEDDVGQIVVGVDPPPPGNEIVDSPAFRRSVYVQVRRTQPLAFLQAFDAPVMEVNCERRSVSTVAPQALMLMNSGFILKQAGYFAARLKRDVGADVGRQIQRAWQLAYCRPPTAEETAQVTTFLAQRTAHFQQQTPPAADAAGDALTSLCQVILSSNEFLYVE